MPKNVINKMDKRSFWVFCRFFCKSFFFFCKTFVVVLLNSLAEKHPRKLKQKEIEEKMAFFGFRHGLFVKIFLWPF
jgi:hypothetical protein